MLALYPVSDEYMIHLLSKYPFLSYENLRNNLDNNWYKIWDGSGWELLWKNRFMPRLFKVFDSWTAEEQANFRILDTKSKYGMLRLSTSAILPDDLEFILEQMSMFTCERCGAEPIDDNGQHYIYRTSGWIAHLCKDCADKINYYDIKLEKVMFDDVKFELHTANSNKTIHFKYNKTHDWLERC